MTAPNTALPTTTGPTTTTVTVTVDGVGALPVTVTERGHGRPVLLLHGGAGPQSVSAFADRLAAAEGVRVITPVHPGFAGTPRPEALAGIPALAAVHVAVLDALDLADVVVVGNSVGGWVAAEMALTATARLGQLVLVDAVGPRVAGHPVVDFFSLTLDQVAELSYHDPDPFRIDPTTMSDAQRTVMGGNRAALAAYGGTAMTDPTLLDRLAAVTVPTLAVWGDSDRIVDPEVGQAIAAAVPGARFTLLKDTGHVPQLESPQLLLDVLHDELTTTVATPEAPAPVLVSIVGPDDGDRPVDGPVRMRILEDGSTTGHRLGIGEITLAPHTDGPPQHRHAQHDEGFYVVSGTARFTVGTQSHDVGPGTLVMVPPGAPHTFANPSDGVTVLLNTFTPDLYVTYFSDLGGLLAQGAPPTDAAVAEVMARYATEPSSEYAPAQAPAGGRGPVGD